MVINKLYTLLLADAYSRTHKYFYSSAAWVNWWRSSKWINSVLEYTYVRQENWTASVFFFFKIKFHILTCHKLPNAHKRADFFVFCFIALKNYTIYCVFMWYTQRCYSGNLVSLEFETSLIKRNTVHASCRHYKSDIHRRCKNSNKRKEILPLNVHLTQ